MFRWTYHNIDLACEQALHLWLAKRAASGGEKVFFLRPSRMRRCSRVNSCDSSKSFFVGYINVASSF